MGIETTDNTVTTARFNSEVMPDVRMASALRIKQLLGMVPADRHFQRAVRPALAKSLNAQQAPVTEIIDKVYDALKENQHFTHVDPRNYGEKVLAKLMPETYVSNAQLYYRFRMDLDTAPAQARELLANNAE